MPVERPYYGLHQINLGKYTNGNEYVLDSGEDYIGLYHILPNGQVFTGARPKTDARELYVKLFNVDDNVRMYNKVLDIKINRYVSPVSYSPRPDETDYEQGQIQRYFVQKRNNPFTTITEIDGEQYNSINRENNPGINEVVWNSVLINWKISLLHIDEIIKFNGREVKMAEENFAGLSTFLTNLLEFYR